MMSTTQGMLFAAVEKIEKEALDIVWDAYTGNNDEVLSHSLREEMDRNKLPWRTFSGDNLYELLVGDSVRQLAKEVLGLPGGEGSLQNRLTAVENGLETLLGAAKAPSDALGDLYIGLNLIPKLIKGATKVIFQPGHTEPVYEELSVLGQKPLFSLTLLPPGSLEMMVKFLVDPRNWK